MHEVYIEVTAKDDVGGSAGFGTVYCRRTHAADFDAKISILLRTHPVDVVVVFDTPVFLPSHVSLNRNNTNININTLNRSFSTTSVFIL
jgi:hypothetical protein